MQPFICWIFLLDIKYSIIDCSKSCEHNMQVWSRFPRQQAAARPHGPSARPLSRGSSFEILLKWFLISPFAPFSILCQDHLCEWYRGDYLFR